MKSVWATMDTVRHKGRTIGEDNAVCVVEFDGGVIGLAEDSWAKPGGMDDRIEVYGTTGVSFADLFRGNAAQTYSEEGYGYAAEKAGSTQGWTYTMFEEVFNQGYPHELQHFIECVRENKTPLVTGEDGRAVLEMIYAAYASARSGAKVRVAVPPEGQQANRPRGAGVLVQRTTATMPVVTCTSVAPSASASRSAHGQSRRGRQQYRFTAAKPRSGNVWHARCDSLSTTTPVTPPASGNWCQIGRPPGRSASSSTIWQTAPSISPAIANRRRVAPVRVHDPLAARLHAQ